MKKVVFMNEFHIIKNGLLNIWMIDNERQDNYNIYQIIKEVFVTFYKEPNLGEQNSYKYLLKIKKEVMYLCVFDMDEFLYSKEKDNLKQVISNINLSSFY